MPGLQVSCTKNKGTWEEACKDLKLCGVAREIYLYTDSQALSFPPLPSPVHFLPSLLHPIRRSSEQQGFEAGLQKVISAGGREEGQGFFISKAKRRKLILTESICNCSQAGEGAQTSWETKTSLSLILKQNCGDRGKVKNLKSCDCQQYKIAFGKRSLYVAGAESDKKVTSAFIGCFTTSSPGSSLKSYLRLSHWLAAVVKWHPWDAAQCD